MTASRLNTTQLTLMIIVALFLDLVSIIPGINILVTIAAAIIFGIWYYVLGMGVINLRKLAGPIIAGIVEVIPAISIIPSITLMVLVTYGLVKAEEKTGINPSSIISGGGNINK